MGEVMIREEIFEEVTSSLTFSYPFSNRLTRLPFFTIRTQAKLRDMLVQRRITREGIRWETLPYSVQREVDAIRDLYASAAASGHPTAAYNLGLMYYLGKGVAKDLRRAVSLLQQVTLSLSLHWGLCDMNPARWP
jgi:hypothetical protein